MRGYPGVVIFDTHPARFQENLPASAPRFSRRCHVTPTSASWLNLVECWFALLSRRRLERGVFTSTADLETAIQGYIAETNAHPKPFVWTKTADEVLANVARFTETLIREHPDLYAAYKATGTGGMPKIGVKARNEADIIRIVGETEVSRMGLREWEIVSQEEGWRKVERIPIPVLTEE
ncbi:hypothetical protein [Methylobacterium nodulans]|uniref:Transposase n=1 Tax=Methylobacterium nodulans (strain LMG 21967 / CNCM I-2342 / ORS 2060) TaxID=460265 RepID=B8IHR2_METNO|nr:hypothetical protein Mnod_0932 [Methylobacterium nodulans ORS 2060]